MQTKTITLTGITPSGTPHLGNYVGAIRPALHSVHDNGHFFFFLSDYHSLVKCQDPLRVQQSTLEVAASWLAAGLDPEKVLFYRQSDIPEIPELMWILSCMAAKGLLNRAHAYKAAVAQNEADQLDADKGISMGLYSYPVLMAADILLFNAQHVPVGRDQVQHIEMARDIALRFNHHYGEHFTLPEATVDDSVATLSGLDGRKMSKSYNNTIPLFSPEKKLRKLIMKIKTNSLLPGEPKQTQACTLFELYKAFATKEEAEKMSSAYAQGIAWGEAKEHTFELINQHLSPIRARYEALIEQPHHIDELLQEGAEKARDVARPLLDAVKKAVGLTRLAKKT